MELDATRKQVEEMIGKGNAAPNGHIPFTPHAKQVLEFSLREALQLGHSYIGTEHILLGLIREGEGVGTQVLIKMDVDLGELRSATIDMIRGNSGTGTGDGKGDLANAGGVTDKQNKSGSAILDQFGRNLTAEAAEGKLDPVIGRTNEIERVMVVLSRRTKNNPVLIGEPGVGKTAVVEGLAQKIQAGDVPETLKGKQVYSLDLGSMVAGSRYRGDFEERLKKVLKEIKTRGDIVLFIDEIHTIVGAGSADGALGASDMLKPMLARGELQTIGATTTDEYRKYIEKDAALERRFQPIQVHEPTIAETIEILKGLRSRYENHHHVTITDGALQSAAELSSRYIQDRNLPDKAIDLIDEAGARLRIKRLTAPPELKELDEKIAKIAADKDEAIKGQDFEKAAELRDKQEKLEADRKQKEDSWREGESDVKMVVDEDVIAEVAPLFPGEYFHIGGDECPKTSWEKCPLCQARIRKEGLKGDKEHSAEEKLQSYFVQRMEKVVNKHGKKMIGWDEILEGGLAPSATVMSWRGEEGGIAAASMNHDVIMTPGSEGMYIDQFQGDYKINPVSIGGFTTAERVYKYNPVPDTLAAAGKGHFIKGVQCNVWSEYLYNTDIMEYRIYPRILALSEIAWSPLDRKDYKDFERRLDNAQVRLDGHGINYYIPQPEQPNGSCNFVAFTDKATMTFTTNRPMKMVYTLDGTEPTPESTVYTAPFDITETTTVKIASVLPSGKMGKPRTILVEKQTLAPAKEVAKTTPGLDMEVFDGMYLSVNNLEAAQKTGKKQVIKTTRELTNQVPAPESMRGVKQYAAIATGYVNYPGGWRLLHLFGL